MFRPLFRASPSLAVALAVLLPAGGCGRHGPTGSAPQPASGGSVHYLDLPQVEARAGTAVAILIDTSGSMGQSVRGTDGRDAPKYQIARRALERIIQHTAEWKKRHPDHHLELAIYRFSSSVSPVLPMGEFDPDKARAALNNVPAPHGGTAIGAALEEGYRALFQAGCTRKFIVCVTDGENTSGPPPSVVAVNLDQQTGGAVRLEFVAFNTSARQFQFLHRVNGQVVEAANGPQLEAELKKIYEQRILKAEAEEPEK